MAMCVLPSCISVYHMRAWYVQGGHKRVSDFLELKLTNVNHHHVDAGNGKTMLSFADKFQQPLLSFFKD